MKHKKIWLGIMIFGLLTGLVWLIEAEEKVNVLWSYQMIEPVCPNCCNTVDFGATKCPSCKSEFRWTEPKFENTPQGALAKFRYALKYKDAAKLKEVVIDEEKEKTIGWLKDGSKANDFISCIPKQTEVASADKSSQIILVLIKTADSYEPYLINAIKKDEAWKVDPSLVKEKKLSESIKPNEVRAIAGLEMLVRVEATWMQQNPAGTSVRAYWTYDISCFHRMYRAGKATKCNFIDISFAQADAAPFAPPDVFGAGVALEDWSKVPHMPKSGYFYTVLTGHNTVVVGGNRVGAEDQYDFGFCAFPADYGVTGVNTFIVNAGGTIFKRNIPLLPKEKFQVKKVLSADDTKRATSLIEQLGSDDWQKREDAQSALIKIGKIARELLENEKNSKDPEIRMRVNAILKNNTFSDKPESFGGIDRWPAPDPTTVGWSLGEGDPTY